MMKRGAAMNTTAIMTTNNQVQITDVAQLMDRWTRFIEGTPKTVETYTRAVRQFVKWCGANEITQPVKEDVKAFREEMKLSHKPTTVQAYIMAVRQFFKWTSEEGIYPNIAANVKGVKLDSGADHKKDELTSAQAKKLISSIDRTTLNGKRDYAMIVLMITTGMRTIEVERATIGDMRALGDTTVLYYQGKGRSEKVVFKKLAAQVEDAIRDYLRARGKADDTEALFISTAHRNAGEGLTTRSISRIVKERLKAAGLDSPYLTAHSLRHTCATQNLLNGGSLEETQQLLDHRNIATTMIYAHHIDQAKRQAEQRIADSLFA